MCILCKHTNVIFFNARATTLIVKYKKSHKKSFVPS